MIHKRSFLGIGLSFIVLGCWALGLWYVSDWSFLAKFGGVLAGLGSLLVCAGLYFRWQGWE